jgi:hypothetical protein
MTVDATDERAHDPGPSSRWWETWHLDVATGDGIGLSVRLACSPALGVAWWWTHLLLPDLPGPVVVRDHEVPLPRQGLEVRADGLWGELTCETALEHWSYGLEAFGVRLDEPADALHGEIGERMPVGFDIEWEIEPDANAPHERPPGWPVRGYAQTGIVRGEVLLGRSRFDIEAFGQRTHTWGEPRFEAPARSAWLHTTDVDASFVVLADGRVDGYVAPSDIPADRISGLREETRRGLDGLPVAARYVIEHELEVDVEVLGLAPVPLEGPTGRPVVLTRALCRYGAGEAGSSEDSRTGNGWASWLDPG